MLLFDKKEFRPHWFETGTPNFLVKLLKEREFYLPDLENLEVGEEILSSIDLDDMPIESLLFQTGYLTIKKVERIGSKYFYTLNYPNLEVRTAFNDSFLNYVLKSSGLRKIPHHAILQALIKSDLSKLKDSLQSFFVSIPYHWYTKNELDKYEGFYASLIYALFNGAGIRTIPEDTTNKGRIDLSVFIEDKIYIIEFKVLSTPTENPLKQIKEKRYYEKYLNENKEIYIVGIEFSESERNIVGFSWERVL